MAGPIVLNKIAIVHLNFSGPVVVDVSCDTVAMEITPNIDEVDVGTFCNPVATDTGRVTYSAVLAMLWSPELYAKLLPHVGEQGTCTFAPDNAHALDYIIFNTRYAALPWGRFELGQRVEVDLPLAVLNTPTWVDGAGLLAAQTEPPAEPAPAEVAA